MEAVLNGPFGQVSLGPQPLTIGRTATNQLILSEPQVSTHHAEIRPQGQDYALVDLGSTNGTFVNDQRLASNQPRVLRPGDIIVIGDTRFTYDVPGDDEVGPTVYAGSWESHNIPNPSSTPAIAPTVASHTGYGAETQQAGAYPPRVSPGYGESSPYYGAPVSSYGADAGAGMYQAPPPPPTYADVQPAAYPQGAPYAGTPVAPPAPAPRPNRRRLWIILGAIGGLVVIAIVLFVVIGYVNRATPTTALNNYCSALTRGDYQSAYNQLSSSQQALQTESQFAANVGKVVNCAVSNVNDSAGTGTITYTLSNGVSVTADETLVNENGAWKIKSEQPRSTPTLTLATFCNALKVPDFQSAYNQLSSSLQSQETEVQFADFGTTLLGGDSGKVTSCTLSNVNDTAATGTVKYTLSDGGSLVADYTLVKENNTWKIQQEQFHSAPVLTLANFCYAVKTGDYQTAYNQLSASEQSGATEAQFAAALSSNPVMKCTLSSINDAAGTGTVSYTFARGNTSVISYTVVQENSVWKINSGKQIG